mmetsp:Transcript_9218/g.22642  ORF Transcript_9218/g.22642 Transcript_9218/m.22642 type:complete len:630 (+) Transcript_9218:199-2088(+)
MSINKEEEEETEETGGCQNRDSEQTTTKQDHARPLLSGTMPTLLPAPPTSTSPDEIHRLSFTSKCARITEIIRRLDSSVDIAVSSVLRPNETQGYRMTGKYTINPKVSTTSPQQDQGAHPLIQDVLSTIRDIVTWERHVPPQFWREVTIRVTCRGSVLVNLQVCPRKDLPVSLCEAVFKRFTDRLCSRHQTAAAVTVSCGPNATHARRYCLHGQERVVEDISGVRFLCSASSFVQGNRFVADTMYRTMFQWTKSLISRGNRTYLHIVGRDCIVPSLHLRSSFKTVYVYAPCNATRMDLLATLAEQKEAVADSIILEEARNRSSAAERFARIAGNHSCGNYDDFLIVGSGRNGLGNDVLTRLINCRSLQGIIYQACCGEDILKRELESLASSGIFRISKARIFDAFPDSKHSLTLIHLERSLKVLLLPIGVPGIGKTELGKRLHRLSRIPFFHLERDHIFHLARSGISSERSSDGYIRSTGKFGNNKARKVLRERMRWELNRISENVGAAFAYVDTCNLKKGGREAYIQLMRPDITVFINLLPSSLNKENLLQDAVERASNRCWHPIFPKNRTRGYQLIKNCIERFEPPCSHPRTVEHSGVVTVTVDPSMPAELVARKVAHLIGYGFGAA